MRFKVTITKRVEIVRTVSSELGAPGTTVEQWSIRGERPTLNFPLLSHASREDLIILRDTIDKALEIC